MTSERWGLLVGFTTIVVLRIMDFYLPKGWHSLWLKRHAFKDDKENEDVDE